MIAFPSKPRCVGEGAWRCVVGRFARLRVRAVAYERDRRGRKPDGGALLSAAVRNPRIRRHDMTPRNCDAALANFAEWRLHAQASIAERSGQPSVEIAAQHRIALAVPSCKRVLHKAVNRSPVLRDQQQPPPGSLLREVNTAEE